MKYRPEIDGLRAIAVVPVILFHAGFEIFSGGFVGVDVFFVISGYLITTLIIEDLESDRFNIIAFYERRARRILPPLFFVMLLCIPFAVMWMFPYAQREFAQSLLAVSIFMSNILFWKQQNYFAGSAEEKPLLHTWSLAVEEQYYVFFPIFLMLMWRYRKDKIVLVVVILSMCSLALSEWGWRNSASANFYLAPMRAWELFAGSLSAFILHKRGSQSSNALSMLGMVFILFSIFAYDEATPFPSVYALVPVIGVVMIILFAEKETLIAKLLSLKVFVGIGLISYSAYLWHQPLFAFGRLRLLGDLGQNASIALVMASFILAYFTWLVIENPIRRRQILKTRISIFSFSATFIIGFSVIGIAGHKLIDKGSIETPVFIEKFENRSDYIANNYFLIAESWEQQKRINGIPFFGVSEIPNDRELLFDLADDRKKILVAGNSHSVDFFNVLHFSEVMTRGAQLARFGVQIRDIDEEFFQSPNYMSSDIVIYCSLFEDADINNIERVVRRSMLDGKSVFVCENIFTWMERANYTKLDKLILKGMRDGFSNENLARQINTLYTTNFMSKNFVSVERGVVAERLQSVLVGLAAEYSLEIIDRMSYVCPNDQCDLVSDEVGKYTFDMGHHTMLGAQRFGSTIDDIGLARRILGK